MKNPVNVQKLTWIRSVGRFLSGVRSPEEVFNRSNAIVAISVTQRQSIKFSPNFQGTWSMLVTIFLRHPRGNHVCVIHFVNLKIKQNWVGHRFLETKEFEVMIDFQNLENVVFVCDAVKHGVESVEKIGHLQKCFEFWWEHKWKLLLLLPRWAKSLPL